MTRICNGCSAAAIADFWQSWQTWKHVSDFCFELGESGGASKSVGDRISAEEEARKARDFTFRQMSAFGQSVLYQNLVQTSESELNGLILAPEIESALARKRQSVVHPLLRDKSWSRSRWAARAGVSKNSVYEYLSGKRSLSKENKQAMADVLGVDAATLPE